MTPAQRMAAAQRSQPATPPAAISESDARSLAAQLTAAIHLDDKDAGIDALTGLIAGIAINLARIADKLAPT